MKKENIKKKKILTYILAAGVICTSIPVLAEQSEHAGIVTTAFAAEYDNTEFRYVNEDSDEIKNANITEEEAQRAKEEWQTSEIELGYGHGVILVGYNRKKAAALAEQLGLESEWELYKRHLRDQGDNFIETVAAYDDEIIFLFGLNPNKSVITAVTEYNQLLEGVGYAEKEAVGSSDVPTVFRISGVYPIYNDDSVSLGCVHENAGKNTKYRWEYCKIGSNEWQLLSDWSTSEWCTWFPDANEDYAVVCKASYNGDGITTAETAWYASRPQMTKRITGRCVLPSSDGLLFGCTSTIGKNDAGYLTTCYIWSFDRQTWITQSAYEASNCAWFRTSGLSKGTYMMYNCTEKRMPNGERRKLSCDYYLFTI